MTILLYSSLLTDSVLPDRFYLSSQGVALLSHPDKTLHEIIIVRGLKDSHISGSRYECYIHSLRVCRVPAKTKTIAGISLFS